MFTKIIFPVVMILCLLVGLAGCGNVQTASSAVPSVPPNSSVPPAQSAPASSLPPASTPPSSSAPASSAPQSSSAPEAESVAPEEPENTEPSFALPQTEGLLYIGYSFRLRPYSLDDETDESTPEGTYTFASSDEEVGTVDADGIMFGAGAGVCTITVTDENGGSIEYTLTVVVPPKPRQTQPATGGTAAAPGTPGADPAAPADGGGGAAPDTPPPADNGGGTPAAPPESNPYPVGSPENPAPLDPGYVNPNDLIQTEG